MMSDNDSSMSGCSMDSFGNAPLTQRNTRGERRARKMLLRHSKKILGEVSRVVFRLADDSLYVIENPDVYKNPNLNTYLVFGALSELQHDYNEVRDFKVRQAANQLQAQISGVTLRNSTESVIQPIQDEDENLEPVDKTGVNSLDIELVMSQAGVSRAQAVDALRAHNHDLVNAIMGLMY